MSSIKAVDLFSGPGGLTIGFKRAGVSPICAVEKKLDAVETYSQHTPEALHFNDDIRNVDFTPFCGEVDLVYGGPPCQPFSTGGLSKGRDDIRNMIPSFLEVVKLLQPSAFLMENVPGLAARTHIGYLYKVLCDISALGYKPAWDIVIASNYGVPQKRHRLIIIALRDRFPWFPRPTHGVNTDLPVVKSGSIISHKALGEPLDCPVTYAKRPDPRPSPYAGHVYNGGGRPINLEAPCPTILASAGGNKTHWVDTLRIAPDYSKHLMAGGKPREGEVPGARRLTVKESSLLQTFPEDLDFIGSRSSRFTQIGNAVPPLLAEALAKSLVQQMQGFQPNKDTHFEPSHY